MRIGIDGAPLATVKTGVGHYTNELARELALAEPDGEFELISYRHLDLEDAANFPPNLSTVQVPRRSRWMAIGLPIYARQRQLTLFHGTNYEVPLWAGCATVVTIHDLSLLLHAETHRPALVRRAKRRLPLMTRIATRIITVSESAKREICEHLKVPAQKVVVVPNAPRSAFRPAADTSATRRRLGIEDDFVLFVGTVEPRKNLATLIRAFDDLLRTTSLSPQLVIAGPEGWLCEDLLDPSHNEALRNRVLFTGYLADDDLRTLYSSCRAFIYPSIYEGFGLPPLEAMACGAAVITSRIPAIVETVGDAARLIDPKASQELTASLVEFLTDNQAREHFAAAGLKRAAEFTWQRTARLTLEVYRDVLNNTH